MTLEQRADHKADSELIDRLDALDRAREIIALYFPAATLDEVDAVRGRARTRLRHGTSNTVVAVAGATGSGKSSIVNRLAEAPLSEASVRRPTTSATHAVVWGSEDAGPLLDWLEIGRRHQIDGSTSPLDGLVLLDLPDHDSTAIEHRIEVDRLVELVDVLMWVTDPQKYADAAMHIGYIQPLAKHHDILRFVLNQTDRLSDGGRQVALDFQRLLTDDGIDNPAVVSISAATGAGFDDLESMLEDAIKSRTASLVRVGADLAEIATGLGRQGALEGPTSGATRRLVDGLSEAAGSEIAADVARRHHQRQGNLSMGWPFTRFVRRLARKPLADLPGPGRVSAAEPRADLALRDFVDEVAGDSVAPWPAAVRAAATEQRDELLDDLRHTVGRETIKAGTRPRWWLVIAWLQRLFAGAAVAGLVWLIIVAVLGGFFQLATDPLLPETPGADWIPLPSALLLGGALGGLLIGLLVRVPLGIGARRRGHTARREIERMVGEHCHARVVDPASRVTQAHDELDRLRLTIYS